MPNFQGAVNEVINQAGLYSALAGGPQDLKERIKLGKEEKIVGKQLQNVGRDIAETHKSLREARAAGDHHTAAGLVDRVAEQGAEVVRLRENDLGIRERQYQLNPTQKNYDAVMSARTSLGSLKETMASLEERQNQAMSRVQEQAEAKKTQRRNFMEYLKKQPVSLGGNSSGTVGDLPKPLQKQIASQYTKSQRKTMMDRMDEEAKNGKQK